MKGKARHIPLLSGARRALILELNHVVYSSLEDSLFDEDFTFKGSSELSTEYSTFSPKTLLHSYIFLFIIICLPHDCMCEFISTVGGFRCLFIPSHRGL